MNHAPLSPQDFLDTLSHDEQTAILSEQLDVWVITDPKWLFEVGQRLLLAQVQPPSKAATTAHSILQTICTTPGKAQRCLSISLLSLCSNAHWLREGISRLASHHDAFVLITTLLEQKAYTLLPLALNEFVARGVDFRSHPDSQELLRRQQDSPYRQLPLYPLPEERGNTFPFYSNRAESQTINFGFPERGFWAIDRSVLPILELELMEDAAITLPVKHWIEGSSGSLYGITGQLHRRTPPETWLPQLSPFQDCQGIILAQCTPTQCFSKIFNAASTGAAYSKGAYGGLGRLQAWQGLAALLRLPVDSPVARIAQRMRQATWWEFGTDTWFVNSWLDLGIATYWPNEEGIFHFGVLAATDTDL